MPKFKNSDNSFINKTNNNPLKIKRDPQKRESLPANFLPYASFLRRNYDSRKNISRSSCRQDSALSFAMLN
jgi:hypothetical protein